MTNDIETYGADNPLFLNNVVSCIGGREENQDSCSISETRRGLLVIVCDGMGGMTGGGDSVCRSRKNHKGLCAQTCE